MATREQDGLVRRNSSFLGTIKTLVTAPLNWFAPQDPSTKRRRSSPLSPDHQPKRIRRNSPPRPSFPPPPAARRHPSVVPRASSAVLPSHARAAASPRRQLAQQTVSRTRSTDPPRRDASFNFRIDSDSDMLVDRDPSLPPSPRLSFRMRSSLTPQPQQRPARYISEPPPLNALISNPTFLHPPPQPTQEPSLAPTLGTLADSVRATRPSAKPQRSTLLFSSNASTEERALQQLDVYKTPLLPTRLHSFNIPASIAASTTPDLFKSRRSSKLILMQDDRERVAARSSGKSPLVNETKPYAGEGGMKKLLARRKLEEEEEGKETKIVQTDEPAPPPRQPSPSPSAPPPVPPPPPPSDWFFTATSASSASGSSLRVGRTKTSRNHIQRPSKARFSAVYDEDADDGMDEDENRQKERQMLEEAAKKAPVFQIPADFSFAKDVPPVKPADLDNAKEPPISALPFSFAKPTTAPTPVVPVLVAEPCPAPASEPKAADFSLTPATGGIPNFFANSQVLAKAKENVVPTPPLSFALPTPSTQPVRDSENPFWDGEKESTAQGPKSAFDSFAAPSSKEGESSVSTLPSFSKPATEPTSSLPFSFGKPAQVDAKAPESAKLPFSFGPPAVEVETTAPKPLFVTSGTPAFGDAFKPSGSLFGEQPKPGASLSVEQPKSTVTPVEAPKPAASPFGEQPKASSPFEALITPQPTPSPLPFSFGPPQTSASSASAPAVPEPPSQPNFFGAPSSTTIEAPKPLFGGNNAFSFGQPQTADKEKESKPASPFSFGAPATSSAAETKLSPAPMFTFGQPSTASPAPAASGPAPIAFSFSAGGGTAADVSHKTPFMFGQPTNLTPTDRPVTPPKNNEQDSRMEESPTRDMQQVNGTKPASTLNGAFSFGSTTNGGTLFGGQSTAPSFGFGTSSSANPFAAKDNKDGAASKGFGGFGQNVTPITTSFSFGQPGKPAEEPQRPSTAGAFSFGTTPTSATSAPSAFAFGAPAATNPFGQTSSGSAPSSPSTFNQPNAFSFGATNSTLFAFGSQPNSPAGGANLTLPAAGFGNGAPFGQVQPSSPFAAPIALAPSTSGGGGGSLFTIGAAPAPGGPRQIKKLPNRRGGAKR